MTRETDRRGTRCRPRRRIVHRDLKPANIKIPSRRHGQDSRLRPCQSRRHRVGLSGPHRRCRHRVAAVDTRAGVILGTARLYEPRAGTREVVDKRADIWAFGCVLFAMLTGRAPFGGDTLSDAIAATLSSEPDWSALPPDTPESVHRLLQRCLQRDLRRRLRDIGDACAELDEPMQPRQRTGVASIASTAHEACRFNV